MKKWILASILLGLLASCKSKALPNEDFNSLSPDELEVVREMRRQEILRKETKKRRRKRVWRGDGNHYYYSPYVNPYNSYNRTQVRNRILYPNVWK